jgi:hypothetical protein
VKDLVAGPGLGLSDRGLQGLKVCRFSGVFLRPNRRQRVMVFEVNAALDALAPLV